MTLPSSRRKPRGFTLVELLVVIGLIAVLISILMPALSMARRAANTVVCSANLKTIATAMIMYANENNGAILGNAWTSGAFLKSPGTSYSDFNCPNVCQTWDWMAPAALELGAHFDMNGSIADRTQRFLFLCRFPAFQCPENQIDAPPYGGSPITVTAKQISYVTALAFQYVYSPDPTDGSRLQKWINTGNYHPNISQVGDTSTKIFMSDGMRWQQNDYVAPDYNIGWDNSGVSPGGQYADWGPWDSSSRAFLPNTPLVLSMPHGPRQLGLLLGDYRFNAAFFDGHVETLDGATGANPNYWCPHGATFQTANEFTPAATQLYGGGSYLVD